MNQDIQNIIATWKEEPRESAERLIEYYGEPDEYSTTQLIWHGTSDGWKRTVLVDEMIPHEFPARHHDFLEQFIDYKVPVSMYSDLAAYDGSLIAERTKGELSARCGGTGMNFVAVNLAHDIVTGKRTVEEARAEYARLYKAYQDGHEEPYTKSFQFELPLEDTKDIDVAIL